MREELRAEQWRLGMPVRELRDANLANSLHLFVQACCLHRFGGFSFAAKNNEDLLNLSLNLDIRAL